MRLAGQSPHTSAKVSETTPLPVHIADRQAGGCLDPCLSQHKPCAAQATHTPAGCRAALAPVLEQLHSQALGTPATTYQVAHVALQLHDRHVHTAGHWHPLTLAAGHGLCCKPCPTTQVLQAAAAAVAVAAHKAHLHTCPADCTPWTTSSYRCTQHVASARGLSTTGTAAARPTQVACIPSLATALIQCTKAPPPSPLLQTPEP
jgi:hypothetical protein